MLLDALAEELNLDTRLAFPQAVYEMLDAMVTPIQDLLTDGFVVLDERPRDVAVQALRGLELDELHAVALRLDMRMTIGADTEVRDLPDVVRRRIASFLSPRVQNMVLRWEKAERRRAS